MRPSVAVATVAPAERRRRSGRRHRSGRPPSGSPSRRRPRPPLRRRCRPPEHSRRRQAEDRRRFFLVAAAVRSSSAAGLVIGEFAASLSTCWCPPFVSLRRRSPASMRARAARVAAGADVIADVIGVRPP